MNVRRTVIVVIISEIITNNYTISLYNGNNPI